MIQSVRATIALKRTMIQDFETKYKDYFDNIQGNFEGEMRRDSDVMSDIKDKNLKKSLISQWENKYLNYFDNIQKTLDNQFLKDSVLLKKIYTNDDENLLDEVEDQNQYFIASPHFQTVLDDLPDTNYDQPNESTYTNL